MSEFKVKPYKGQTLPGLTTVTRKVDGVRAERASRAAAVLSRKGKPLYNVPTGGVWTVAEIFLGTWEKSVSACRTHEGKPIQPKEMYEIRPVLDPRLILREVRDLDKKQVQSFFDAVRANGDEGLVLHHESGRMFKVVSRFFHDVKVLGVKEGKPGSKYVGMLGALVTAKGDVGAGLTDAQRKKWWGKGAKEVISETIEVGCKGLTPGGKFRDPSFERLRWDK